jgi:hypothetical protein
MSKSFLCPGYSRRHGSIAGGLALSLFIVVLALFGRPSSAHPGDLPQTRIHIYFGQYTTDNMGDTLKIFKAHYEKNYLLAGAYSRDFLELRDGTHLGGEIGVAARFGTNITGELWGGVVFRPKAFTSREGITVGMAFTVGLSAISKSMGEEIKREIGRGGNASFLFYLGPEIVVTFPGLRNWELVYRLHHRSGAGGLLGGLYEGYNSNTFGLRYRF